MAKSAGWVRAGDIRERIRELLAATGMQQQELASLAGVIPEQVSSWVSERKGAALPPRSRLQGIALRGGWPISIFEEGGPRPAEVIHAPLTDPGLTAGQVAERLVRATAPRPLTASERIQRAMGMLDAAQQELRAALSEGRRGTDDLIEFVKTAEAGHPVQPPPAVRKGKSG